jgi:hypothetical protein
MLDSVEFNKIPSLQFALPVVAADPTGYQAGLIFNSTDLLVKYHDGTAWKALTVVGTPPSGTAGGDLSGSYPNPQIASGVIVDADVNGSANIAQSKIAGLTTALGNKADAARTITAGNGLTGGGDLTANRTIDVAVGTGLTVAADAVSLDQTYTDGRYEQVSKKGVANGYAPLDASNLIPTAHIPPLAISEVFVVASEAAMLALTAQVGDVAIRTDINKTFILSAAPASTLANWKEVMATGQVVSVNGKTGVVTITLAELGGVATSRQVIAGNGLTGGGDLTVDRTLNVANADGTLTVAADDVKVASAPKWTTARSITLTGDVTGTAAAVDGSANVSIATTLVTTGVKRFAANIGNGALTTIPVAHNLGTRDLHVAVYNATTFAVVQCGITMTDTNTVNLTFAVAPASNAYRVVIVG